MSSLASLFSERLQKCADIQSILECVLDQSCDLVDASFGKVQLIDWKSEYLQIKAQRDSSWSFSISSSV